MSYSLLLLLVLQPEVKFNARASRPEIFKTKDNKFVMVISTIYNIPDIDTATALMSDIHGGGDITQAIGRVALIPDLLMKNSYIASSNLPSLIDGGTIDDYLRVRVEKCMILNYINYLVDSHKVMIMMHGALLR